MKGATQIEGDFFNKIKPHLQGFIDGSVYREGVRPPIKDVTKTKEDAVVTFKAGLDSQFQMGEVIVNVYVNDISFNGNLIKNIVRCGQIEQKLLELSKELTDGEYLISLINIPEAFPEEVIQQHYVNARFRFKRITI